MSAAEPKRVSFMTIDTSTDFLKKPEKEKESTTTGKSKTIRLELEICEPDARNCSDFNYKRLIHIEKKKQKKLAKIPNGAASSHEKANDPFGDDEDDIARIAREMEAKYGTGSSYGGKSSTHDVDRGIGYDDNDSFIDNTEAYDEIIPEDVDTVRGGFYVNSGLLEFKKIPNFERPGDEIRMPKAKKRALSTTSESSDDESKRNKDDTTSTKTKKKKKHTEKKVKSATSSSDEQEKAAKKAKKEKSTEKLKPVSAPTSVTNTPSQSPALKDTEKKKIPENTTDDSKKVIKTTTVKDMLRAKRDNLRKLEQGKSSGGTTTTTDNDEDDESEPKSVGSSLAVSESSRDSHNGEVNGIPNTSTAINELTLPTTFSAELVKLITSLKHYVDTTLKNSSHFFDNYVKEQLLQIDTIAKSQNQQVRLQVYQQLETFVPCSKKAILSKVNRYRIQQAEAKIKNEIKKLKNIVNDAMPDLVRKYDEDLKAYENLKDIHQVVGNESFEYKTPRKKYHWNDSSRQILSDTSSYINELFKIMRVKKETLEEFSTRYLKEHLLPLWPEGWIKFEDFHKELERKKKKEARSSQGSTSSPQTPSNNVNGKQSAQNSQSPHHQLIKTESKTKEVDISIPALNGKTTGSIQLSPQSSVIKKASDHSINSIMSSSPSPPIHPTPKTATVATASTPVLSEVKPRIIDLEKLSSPNDLLKVSQKDIARNVSKYSSPIQITPIDTSLEKVHRISDGSDSDCAIIDSPIKSTPTSSNIKPQQQQPFSQHLNNNKLIHSPAMQPQQQGGEIKKTKKHDNDYSSLIKNIASLTNPKTNSSQSFLSSPVLNEQRKMDTSQD